MADEIRSLFPTLVEMEQLKPVTGDHPGPYQSFEGNTVPAGWRIEEVLFSKDGRRLFVLGNKLHVWDLTTGRELLVINYEGGPQTVRSGMVRFEGDKLIVKSGNETLVYDGTPEKP